MKKGKKKGAYQLDLHGRFFEGSKVDRTKPRIATPPDHLSPARVTPVYDVFWYFACERQNIFFKRQRRSNERWTDDPILSEYKFTNAYRAADRVSQYLIRHVIYRDDLPNSEAEVFFRIILFKLFNKIETWQHLENSLGAITLKEYSYARYDALLTDLKSAGTTIYSGAYIMHPGSAAFGEKLKHRNHLKLLESMISEGVPKKLRKTRRMQEGFELLRSYPTLGDFLAYQFITDINYSELTDYSEMEFVVPGPGALDGISKCFSSLGGLNHVEIIRLVADMQDQEFGRLGLDFQSLWGRKLQLIDCQNLFCEISKYSRVSHPEISGVSGRTRIKQKFSPRIEPIEYWFPPKWRLKQGGGR